MPKLIPTQVQNTDTGPGSLREFTPASVLLGTILSVIMGAANVYLGLKAGMTVAAAIPAAVIAMGIFHGVLRRKSILEANIVQTGASAGESLAAGVIFTMPALIMIGVWQTFDYWMTTMIALAGGMLGVLFMIPMRKVFIVDDKELKYPEGVACAEVLLAGEASEEEGGDDASASAKLLFVSLGVGAVFKAIQSFLGLIASTVEGARFIGSRVFVAGSDISAALVGVGVIVGAAISAQIFLGGAIGWLIAIPILGGDPSAGSAIDQAWGLWSTKVRYIGVGTMIVGGIVSIWRVRNGLWTATKEMLGQNKADFQGALKAQVPRTELNMSGATLLVLSLITISIIGVLYYRLLHHHIGITLTTMVIMVVMSFFFTAVATYIVGLVGSSNSPVSGMTITTVLLTGLVLTIFGFTGTDGMVAVLGVAGIVCCVTCTAGDTSNDLKTGYILGATPRKQQWMQMIGVVAGAVVMAPILKVIHEGSLKAGTGGIGGRELPAPQAGLFASLAKGFFGDGALPWNMVYWGIAVGMLLLIGDWILERRKSSFRMHVMPVAIGIYLPLGLSVPIMLGGIINWLVSRKDSLENRRFAKRAVLIASGAIAGESLLGVGLSITRFLDIKTPNLGEKLSPVTLEAISLGALAVLCYWIYAYATGEKKKS